MSTTEEANQKCADRVRPHWESRKVDLEMYMNADDYDDPGAGKLQCKSCWHVADEDEFDKGLNSAKGKQECQECGSTDVGPYDALGPFNEYALAFDYVAPHTFTDQDEGYWRYQISWGGPSDEIRMYGSPSRWGFRLERAEYWFLDWFDGAKIDVTSEPCVRWLWNEFNDTETLQHTYDEAMKDYEPPAEEEEEDKVTTFRLEINCENAAFEGDNLDVEIVRILRKLADRIEGQTREDLAGETFKLKDINGNTVGEAEFEE